jgi:SAM-dependent methyltransferase
MTDLSEADWERLDELRASFLLATDHPGATTTPWASARDLELYDATFGARIGWKWDAALGELERSGWTPPAARVVDWGCGTGAASRALLTSALGAQASALELYDLSPEATRFAAERTPEGTRPRVCDVPPDLEGALVLVSHVLSELDEEDLEALLAELRRAAAVLWVEPGSRAVSRRLSAARDALAPELPAVAPCPHTAACGVLAEGRERDWCHHFARPAPEAFTERHWARFASELGIDLRALPMSWLALDARRAGLSAETDPRRVRVLGRARMEKGRARLLACSAAGLRDLELLKRTDKKLHRKLLDLAGDELVFEIDTEPPRPDGTERITSIES